MTNPGLQIAALLPQPLPTHPGAQYIFAAPQIPAELLFNPGAKRLPVDAKHRPQIVARAHLGDIPGPRLEGDGHQANGFDKAIFHLQGPDRGLALLAFARIGGDAVTQ